MFPALSEPRGVFTTLYLGGQLRGCVGYACRSGRFFARLRETARAAAFEDSRFWPVTPEEARRPEDLAECALASVSNRCRSRWKSGAMVW